MGSKTNISWCDHTLNPWWGCLKVSPGCFNCYADTQASRWGWDIWGPPATSERRLFDFDSKHWREPLGWDKAAADAGERRRVFCASMADWAELHPMVTESRAKLFDLIRATPNLDWLMLTKRPENIEALLPPGYWTNIWLGTSAENQEYADLRVPILMESRRRVPVLFISVEPQIGPISMFDVPGHPLGCDGLNGCEPKVDWVIVGGESGQKHRPFDVQWAKDLRYECKGVAAFHYKQQGGRTHAEGGCLIDGVEVKEFPTPRHREQVDWEFARSLRG